MNEAITRLEPVEVWKHFAALNQVPRASKKEERIIEFMLNFGKDHGLETKTDAVGNVLMRKGASPGMEDRKTVCLQAHLDMVHQKNRDTSFDFNTQGIQMFVDGDWVRARGTTLGADNGLGVAAIMAVLASKSLEHPALEALFTIDEETGMTGAKELSQDWLSAEILLNLDTEEDDEFSVGCAGGVDVSLRGSYREVNPDSNNKLLEIVVNGLSGGHSGMDIHRRLGNANKILARILHDLFEIEGVALCQFEGGSLRNAIPREASAILGVSPDKVAEVKQRVDRMAREIKVEFATEEKLLEIVTRSVSGDFQAAAPEDATRFINVLLALHNGVAAMSEAFPDQTETSNNVARVRMGEGGLEIGCLTRSSIEGRKWDLAHRLRAVGDLAGYNTCFSGDYPGWTPNPESAILELMKKRYTLLFSETPRVMAGHGGLECGLISEKYPAMDLISFGPTIKGAHSPDERASIPSVRKFWKLYTDILGQIPEKE
jgi:dipeptidase D